MDSSIEYEFTINNVELFFSLINTLSCVDDLSYKNIYEYNGLLYNENDGVYKKNILLIHDNIQNGFMKYKQIEYNINFLNTKKNNNFKLYNDIVEVSCSYEDNYIIKFQFIKNSNIENKSSFKTLTELKNNKDSLKYIFDRYVIIVESIDNSNIDPILKLFNDNVDPSYYESHMYQSLIFMISKTIYGDTLASKRFENKSGFKSLVNNVHNLDKQNYASKVLPFIQNYYLCEKTDGKRVLWLVFKVHKDVINLCISDKLYYINKKTDFEFLNGKYELTVLDSELEFSENLKKDDSNIIYKSDITLKVFDILVHKNENTTKLPFEKRLDILKKYKIENIGVIKEFIKLSSDNYNKEIIDFYESVKDKIIDGLIFTPNSSVQYKVFNQGYPIKFLNKNYKNMYCYKWKPSNMITIDFYILKDSEDTEGISKYILFSGINKKSFERNNLSYLSNYKDIVPSKYHNLQYFPIQFSTIDQPELYIYYSREDDLSGKIGEFNYINNEWNLVKIRSDRNVELDRGEYYGNNYDIALITWEMIKNPMNIEDFSNDKLVLDNNYFKTNDNSTYQAQRNYNSFVKSYLLQKITSKTFEYKVYKNWIVDLACGKGQDLFRIANLGFKNGLFIDNDKNALYELNERKKGLSHKINMKIYTKLIDLSNTKYNEILDSLQMIRTNQVNLIICNFAIHYFTENKDIITNLIALINELINKNGIVIFTCFDGNKVFELLKDSNEYSIEQDGIKKYSIIKDYKSNYLQDFGQKIKVLLPFGGKGEYYSEYLVNFNSLNDIFRDYNFMEYSSNSFDTLLNEYNNISLLSEQDKEYISLYRYAIYVKK